MELISVHTRRLVMCVVAMILPLLGVGAGCASVPTASNSSEGPTSTAGSAGPTRWQATEEGTTGTDVTDTRLPTPLAAYALTAREMATLDFARRALWRECLKGFGFDYPVPSYKDLVSRHLALEEVTVSRWFGITNRDTAKVYGMLLPSNEWASDEVELMDSPELSLVLLGPVTPDGEPILDAPASIDGVVIPEGGCAGEASRRLGAENIMNFGDMARDLRFSSSKEFQDSSGYQELQAKWAACMSKAGYPQVKRTYNDPFATKLIASRKEADKPSAEEIEFALASIDCMEEVDVQRRALKLRADFDQALVEKHQLELQEENRQRMDEQVRRATDEVAKIGGFQ